MDDPFIFMIWSDLTQGEVPPTLTLPLRRERWEGEDHLCSFLCNVKVISLGEAIGQDASDCLDLDEEKGEF